MTRIGIFLFSTVTFLMTPAPASSSESTHRVAVIKGFSGPQAERIQGAVETGLKGRFDVVPDSRVAAAAESQGVGLVWDQDFARVGRALDVRAFVSAYTEKQNRGGGWRVRLVVRRGDDGTAVGRLLLTGRRIDRLERTLTERPPARLQALIAMAVTSTPVLDAEEPVLAAASEETPALESDQAKPGELIELTVDGRVFSRSFTYAQNLFRLPQYRLARAFASALEVTVRPGALVSDSLAPIGIYGGLEYGLGVSAVGAGNNPQSSDVRGYSAGLEYRFAWRNLSVAPQGGYASSSFVTGGEGGDVPDVRYSMITGGVAGRWSFAPGFALLSRAAYLEVLSAGPLSQPGRFARASIRGISGEAAVAFAVTPDLEVRASAGLRRYGFDMNSQPGDTSVAGGAIDQLLYGGLGLAYRP
jgi:hypothetical protein